MNELTTVAPPPELSPPATVRGRFTGEMRAFRGLMIRGAFLQVLTLGIYRFWLITDVRRFFWANTEIGGDSPEYTGTAIELLLGFLIAIALLVPIFVLIALASLGLGPIGQISGVVGYVVLAAFAQYAYFRARRYRLTRTVFRGVRMHQSGSAGRYVVRSILWGLLILFTLGLAYPYAQASLERYKVSNTYYGNLQGSFVGSGSSLLLRGFLMWLLTVGPLVASVAIAIALIDWDSIIAALQGGAGRDLPRILESNSAFQAAMGVVGGGMGWVAFFGLVLYPAFQAMVLKWWLRGLRFGPVAVSTRLRTGQVYGVYFRYFGWTLLFILIAILVITAAAFAAVGVIRGLGVDTATGTTLAAIGGVIGYLAFAFCIWVIYYVVVRLRMWRITVDSVDLTGFEAVEQVRADESRPSSAVGEGLVDALGAGGI